MSPLDVFTGMPMNETSRSTKTGKAMPKAAEAQAQALWDRAAYDDATIGVRPQILSGAPPAHADRALAWSPDGTALAVSGDDEVTVFDAHGFPPSDYPAAEPDTGVRFRGSTLQGERHGHR